MKITELLNPIVERARFLKAADPAKMRVGEMPLNLGQARGERSRRQRRDIGGDESHEIALLTGGQCGRAQSLIRHDAIVLKGAAEMQIVGEVAAAGRQVAADHGMRDDRLLLLTRRQ